MFKQESLPTKLPLHFQQEDGFFIPSRKCMDSSNISTYLIYLCIIVSTCYLLWPGDVAVPGAAGVGGLARGAGLEPGVALPRHRGHGPGLQRARLRPLVPPRHHPPPAPARHGIRHHAGKHAVWFWEKNI